MVYEYREVKCPWCDHIFMWNKNAEERMIIFEYRLKTTGEYVRKAKCPRCEKNMLVLDQILEGIDEDDERVEKIGVRGI